MKLGRPHSDSSEEIPVETVWRLSERVAKMTDPTEVFAALGNNFTTGISDEEFDRYAAMRGEMKV